MTLAGTEIDLFTYRPAGCKPQVVLLVFDGQDRHAWSARSQTKFLADRFCGFVVAPEFDEGRFPYYLYQYGGVTAQAPGHRTIDLVPPLVGWARRVVGAPDLPLVVLGHSAGGQIVSRVAAFISTGAAGIIVANPSTWVLPSLTVDAPFGLHGTEAATDDALRAYLGRPITVLLGTHDVGSADLTTGSEARAQGPNRYERGLRTFQMAQDVARSHGWPFGWTLGEVPGVGHSARAMYSSAQAAAAVQRALAAASRNDPPIDAR